MRLIIMCLLAIVMAEIMSGQNINQLRPDTAAGSIPMTVAPYFRQAYARPVTVVDTLTKYMELDTFYSTGDSICFRLFPTSALVCVPSGGGGAADSLGIPITNDYVVLGTGTKAPKEVSNLYLSGANSFKVPNEIRVSNPTLTTSDAIVSIGHGRTGDGNAFLDLYAKSDGIQGARVIRAGGTNGAFNFQNWGTGDMNFYRSTSTNMLTLIGSTGQARLHAYTTGTSFAGTDVGILGHSSTGHIQSMDATDVRTFISAYSLPSLSTNHVIYYNGSDLATDFGDLVWDPDGGGAGVGRMSLNTATPAYTLDVRGAEGTGYFSGFLELDGGIKDAAGDLGTSGQILASTGGDVDWIDNPIYSLPSMSTNHIVYYTGSDIGTDFGDLIWDPNGGGAGVGWMSLNKATPAYTFDVVGNGYFSDFLELDGGLKDASGSLGAANQILASTGSDVVWINNTSYSLPSLSTNHVIYYNGSDLATDFLDFTWDPSGVSAGNGALSLMTSAKTHNLTVNGTGLFNDFLELDGGLKDAAGLMGSANQVLASTGSDVQWVNNDASTTNEVQTPSYTAATGVIGLSLTGSTATIPLFTSSDRGLTPASGGGTTNFLRADGTWASAGDLLGTTVTSGRIVYGSGSAAASQDADLTWNGASNTIFIGLSGSGVDIDDVSGMTTPNAYALDNGSGEGISWDASSVIVQAGAANRMTINSTTMNASVDAYIGVDASDQLHIRTTGTEVRLGSEAASTTYLQFQDDGDIFATAADAISLSATGVLALNGSSVQTSLSDLGVRRTPTTYAFEVSGDAGKTTGGSSWQVISDSIVKRDITYLSNPFEKVLLLKPAKFRYNKKMQHVTNAKDTTSWYYNFIAQDYEEVFPEEVREMDGIKSISADAANMYHLSATQQLIKENKQMQRTIDDMRSVIRNQEDRLLTLEKDKLKIKSAGMVETVTRDQAKELLRLLTIYVNQ